MTEFEGLIDPTFVVTGLTLGQTYEFKVQTRNAYGFSASSETLSVFFAVKPDAPVELAKEFADDKQIKISWKEGASNGGSPVDYTVYYD